MDQDITKLVGILKKNPQDGNVFKTLEEDCRLATDWENLALVYQIRAQAIERIAIGEASSLYFQRGECLEKHLGQADLALESYTKAFLLSKDNQKYFQAALDLAESTRNWTKVAELINERLGQTLERPIKIKLLVKLGISYYRNFQDLNQAKTYLKQVLDLDENLEAIQTLDTIYHQEQDWSGLLDLYQKLAQKTKDKATKIQRLMQCGQICEEYLQSPTQAIACYQSMLQINPEDMTALRKLETLYTTLKQWQQVVAILEKQAQLSQNPDDKVKILYQIAVVWNQKIQDLKSAATCYERILQITPDPYAIDILETTYRFQLDWKNLARILQQKMDLEPSQEGKTRIASEIGEVAENQIQDPEQAILWYQKAFVEEQKTPENLEILHKLQTLYYKTKKTEELLASYRKELNWDFDISAKLGIFQKMADILNSANRWSDSAQVYEDMLQLAPKEISLYPLLSQIYQKIQQSEKQLAVLVRYSEQVEALPKTAVYLDIANLLLSINREQEAIEFYKRILEINPQNIDILRLLKKYYIKTNQAVPLVATISQIIALAPQEAISGYFEIARLQQDTIKDYTAAISTYNKLLNLVPDHLDALRELTKLYDHTGQYQEYINTAEQLCTLVISLQEQLELRYRLAQVLAEQGGLSRREIHLRHILELKSDELSAINHLKQYYQSQNNIEQLIVILEMSARNFHESISQLGPIYLEIGNLYFQREDFEHAVTAYHKAAFFQPEEYEALTQLIKVYEKIPNDSALASILERRALYLTQPSASDDRFQAAKLLEKIDVAQSVSLYERILIDIPEYSPALERLEILLREAHDFEELSQIYDVQTQLLKDVPKLIDIHIKAGAVAEEHLEDISSAMRHYQAVLQLSPGHATALDRLIELNRADQHWTELATLYHKKLAILSDPQDKIALWYELGKIYGERLNQAHQAIECYREVITHDSANRKTILSWKELCQKEQLTSSLLEVLEYEEAAARTPTAKKQALEQLAQVATNPQIAVSYERRILEMSPQDLVAHKRLHTLYRQLGEIANLVQTIIAELEIVTEPETQTQLWIELAILQEERLHKTEDAVASLEKALAIDPRNQSALELLAGVHEQHQNEKELLSVWQRHAEVAPLDTKVMLLVKVAGLLEKQGQDEQAIEILTQVIAQKSQYQPARILLAGLYRKKNEWQNLIHLHQEELQTEITPERQIELWLELAQIWEKLGHTDEALSLYNSVLEKDRENLIVIRHTQEIYAKNGQLHEWVAMMQKELATTTISRARRIALLLHSAEIQEFKLSSGDSAKENYGYVLDLDTQNKIALQGLERIFRVNKEYKALHGILEKELALTTETKHQIPLLWEMAILQEEKFNNPGLAIQDLTRIHQEQPDDRAAIERLLVLLKKQEQWPLYAQLLEEKIVLLKNNYNPTSWHCELLVIYRDKLNQKTKAIEHGEALLAIKPDDLETILALQQMYQDTPTELIKNYLQEAKIWESTGNIERLAYLYREVGKLLQETDKKDEAVFYFQKSLAIQPSDNDTINRVIDLLSQQQKWPELLQVYEMIACLTKNPETLESLHTKMALLHETQFSDFSQALVHYQIAYLLNPKELKNIKGLRNILQRQERWSEAIEIMEREVELLEESKRPSLYLRIGDIWADKLNVPHKALQAYTKVLAQGYHRQTAEKMVKWLEELQDYRGLTDVMEKELRIGGIKTEDLQAKLLRLAELYWKKLKDLPNAARIYDVALAQDKQNVDILSALETILTELKNYPALIAALNRKISLTTNAEEKFQLYLKVAEIYHTKLYLGPEAIEAYQAALECKPDDIETLHKLQQLYNEWGEFEPLISAYQKEIPLAKDQARVVALYHGIADIRDTKLFDHQQAIAIYQKIREIDPQDFHSMIRLASLLRRQEKWAELLATLREIVSMARNNHDIDAEISAQLEIARIERKLQHTPECIAAYQSVLELEEYNEEAFAALEELYLGQKSYHEMVETLEEKVLKINAPEEQLKIYLMLGKMYEENLNNPDSACQAFEKALIIQKDNKTALKSLHRLYETTQQWRQMTRIVEIELELAPEPSIFATLCSLLAQLYSEHLDNHQEAMKYLLLAVEKCPTHSSSLIQLGNLSETEGNWKEAVKFFSQAVEHTPDFKERYRLYLKLGNIYRDHLSQNDQAIVMYQSAMRMESHDAAAPESLADIYFAQSQWPELEPLLARMIPLLPKNHTRLAEWYARWGQVATNIEKIDEAISRYTTSLQLQPKELSTLLALAPLHVQREHWQEALQCYKEAYEHPQLRNRLEVLSQLGNLEERLGKLNEANEHYQQLLAIHPDNLEAMAALARLAMRTENYKESLRYYNEILETTLPMEDDFRYRIHKEKAELLTKMERYAEAMEEFTQVFEYNPQDVSIIAELAQLASKSKDWEQAEHWAQQHYQFLRNAEEKIENRCRYANVLYEGLRRAEDAVNAYREVLEIDPTYLSAIEGIGKIRVALHHWQALANDYQNFLSKLPVARKNIGFPIHIALGHLLAEQLNDKEGAIREFEKALELLPNHEGTQAALAELKGSSPETRPEAIKGHLKLLQRDQFRIASYRALTKLFVEENQKDRALRAYRAIALLEPNFGETCPFDIQPHTITPIPENAIMLNLVPTRIHKLYELLSLVDDTQEKAYIPILEKSWGKHIGSLRPQPPVWYYTSKLMPLLGMKEKQMYMYLRPDNAEVKMENTNPPSLIVGQKLIDMFSESELNFILTKYLFYIQQRQTLALKLPPDDLAVFFKLLKTNFVPSNEELSPEAKNLQKQIQKGIPWRLPGVLRTRGDLWEAVDQTNILAYLKCLEFASNRLALLVTDSLDLSIQMLCRLQRVQRGEKPEKQKLATLKEIQSNDAIADLMYFNLSENYGKIRKLCGISSD